MGAGSFGWEILVVIGPLILAFALAWAMLHNKRSKRQNERTEQATRELYKDPLDHETTDKR
ncbi:hypothetical protein [Sphingomonas sp.]|jgi:hypothetical protein|uniref:hypothetical protein n=1 Tax=Sphingomonas sp. TaxID=28214 RepID=UPI002D7EEF4F|nr:hypothetical protein [Sphingomonas sp.]HEU0043831.1 hypothetical protein [Sphingomonas sp.]